MLTVGEAANRLRRNVKTLQRWDREGTFPSVRSPTGRRMYSTDQVDAYLGIQSQPKNRVKLAYCRVSSQAQKPDLTNQKTIISQFCVARGLANVETIEEIGGGLNFKRPKFLALIDSICAGEVETLILAHKDRLARFGFDLLAYLCQKHRTDLLIINDEKLSPEREMVEDLMTIVHCFSSRLYGLRNYKKALKSALAAPAAP
jgi:putative resolvase